LNATRARIIREGSDSNLLIISLPQTLLSESDNDASTSKYSNILRLRLKMAHEIGHAVLHTKELYEVATEKNGSDSLQGIFDFDAHVFAWLYLKQCKQRERELYRDKTNIKMNCIPCGLKNCTNCNCCENCNV
ncbi:MAG: hypothetical protein FWD96_06405, partial [Defluviitaleaceae bacterium]|nr:hypothetical protein [Defluviitaleaceae bacterium]